VPRASRATASTGNEERGAVCIQRGSLTVVSKVVVPERMPENLPAQPQQYLARSLLGVWHDSQNFVIPAFPRRTAALWNRDELPDDHERIAAVGALNARASPQGRFPLT